MKSPILKSILGLTLLATVFVGGCASDPVVTSQTTSTRRTTTMPATNTVIETPAVQTSTTTTNY